MKTSVERLSKPAYLNPTTGLQSAFKTSYPQQPRANNKMPTIKPKTQRYRNSEAKNFKGAMNTVSPRASYATNEGAQNVNQNIFSTASVKSDSK